MRKSHLLATGVASVAGLCLAAGGLIAGGADTRTKEAESIVRELTQYSHANPDDADSRLKLGVQLMDLGRPAEADKWLTSAAEIDPTLLEVVESLQRQIHGLGEEGQAPVARGGFSVGPDIEYTDIDGVLAYGQVGGIYGFALASDTCNIGNQTFAWANNGTPGLAMNAYRISEGRLVQVGQSWVKHACCAAQQNGCGLGCSPGAGLGPGCLDSYTASWNGGQGRLGKRSGINAWTGSFSLPIGGPAGGAIGGRLQIHGDDLNSTMHPGSQFVAEGVYVCTEDAQAGNRNNNASYRRVNITSTGSISLLAGATTQKALGAIYAWRDHGLGPNMPDNSVMIQEVDVPSEGRFIVADRAKDNGDGTWTYDYAVFNLCSDRSGGSFSVPLGDGVNVTNVGFHDVDYHSGEPYDNTDWNSSVTADSVTWSSPQTFAQNPNSNAIRWGTMYNFWFTADSGPTGDRAVLGLFKPHSTQSVTAAVSVPLGNPCPADFDGDGVVGAADVALLLGAWGTGGPIGDVNGDGIVNVADLATMLGDWGPC